MEEPEPVSLRKKCWLWLAAWAVATGLMAILSTLRGKSKNVYGRSSSHRFSPCSVSTTDLALPTGPRIIPFLCSRSIAPQSCPFHARPLSWIVRKRSASTILASAGKPRALGKPRPNAVKFFNAVELMGLPADPDRLDDATKTIIQHWRGKMRGVNVKLISNIRIYNRCNLLIQLDL